MRDQWLIDDLLPNPNDEPSPSELVADLSRADDVARTSLERELEAAGFDEVSITEQGIGKWKFELVHRSGDFDGSEAFGCLEALLTQFGLVLQENTFEMEISRNLTTASFLCFRDLPQRN
jgi:hypothetical protein